MYLWKSLIIFDFIESLKISDIIISLIIFDFIESIEISDVIVSLIIFDFIESQEIYEIIAYLADIAYSDNKSVPGNPNFSKRIVSAPARFAAKAADIPDGPPPTTSTSHSANIGINFDISL